MSNLAEQLKAVKLKTPSQPMKDFSSPKKAGFISEADIKNYERVVLEVNTECWIDILREETFPTVLCPFLIEEAQVFLQIYRRLYDNKDSETIEKTDWRSAITETEQKTLDTLAKRLQESMDIYTNDGYAFVKTSSRSAKDAPLVQGKLRQMYRQELEKYPTEKQGENTHIICVLKAAFSAMKVKRSDDVLDMFIRSERIFQDLMLAAENQKDKYNEHFVIRKFVDIDVDMEFRGFVWNYDLVALSQYNYAIFSERLVKEKQRYGDLVKKYYDEVVKPKLEKSKFPKDSIVDFAICNEGSKLWVIEINPFLETTDGALFSWQHERHILEGADGFVFRVTEQPRPGAKTILPTSVKRLMEEK